MISVVLLLLMGLLVFGPKRTIEMARSAAQALAQIKRAASEHQSSLMTTAAIDRGDLVQPNSGKNV
jgi:Sec-independent protein translocase protein TatA